MDQSKSLLSPRALVICVATCTVTTLWAVVFAAVYFYFFGPGLSHIVQNVTEVAVPLYRPDQLPWYLNGTVTPTPDPAPDTADLWNPEPLVRLRNQLKFLPTPSEEVKTVLFWSDWEPREVDEYKVSQCPVKACRFIDSRKMLPDADVVVFRKPAKLLNDMPEERHRSQVWVFNQLKPPMEGEFVHPRDVFNWTATQRLDSDVPMFPHGIWMYYDTRWKYLNPPINYVGHKSFGAAAWFPAVCNKETPMYRYVSRLQAHTLVDVFSSDPVCGQRCPQGQRAICLKLLQHKYRVTLVFEDRMCNHTIPDMFYEAIEAETVPVVMYPSRAEYEQLVPEGSFIHVDDFKNTRHLAKHIETIYSDDLVFNRYLSWKGTGMFIKTWYCRLCALLHYGSLPHKQTDDINMWWNPEGLCTTSLPNKTVEHR